jgi:hypothetical protein
MKGDVKKKILPAGWERPFFLASSPQSATGTSLKTRTRHSFFPGERWRAEISRSRDKPSGWLFVPTRVLSEARGLWLFWVVRGGIAWTRRLALKRENLA